jgi:hypothetical protein
MTHPGAGILPVGWRGKTSAAGSPANRQAGCLPFSDRAEHSRLFNVIGALAAAPVDIASLAAFRVLFGLMMAAGMIRFLAKGWVRELYLDQAFCFSYPGFSWVQPWPAVWMRAHFIFLAVVALGMAAGFYYRVCAVLFFLGFAYVELIDQTLYLNHYYLVSLISGLMIFLPANRAWSWDAWCKPQLRLDAIPCWCLYVLRFQVGLVYLFAGLAKLTADWLFQAEPLRIWLAARGDLPWIGPWLGLAWVAYAASWFGAVFDCSIVFLLLYKPARKIAFLLVVVFHAATWVLFNIGMFPWIMIACATLFFDPDWPRQLAARLSGLALKPGRCVAMLEGIARAAAARQPRQAPPGWSSRAILAPLGIFALIQLALPLRSYFVTGPPAWSCTGFNCAWRVMIAEKTGYAEFYACDQATGRRHRLSIDHLITPRQQMMMAQDPDLIRSMARRLAAELKARGQTAIRIEVDAYATLNGRPSQRLIKPGVDLAGPLPSDWIVPLAGP